VSIVDDISKEYEAYVEAKLDSSDTFRVIWADGKFPVAKTGCGGACTVRDTTCVCSTTLSDDVAFTDLPSSRNQVISKRDVGAVDPAALDTDTYTVGAKNSEVTVYFLRSNPGFTTDTILPQVGIGGRIVVESRKNGQLFRGIFWWDYLVGSTEFSRPPAHPPVAAPPRALPRALGSDHPAPHRRAPFAGRSLCFVVAGQRTENRSIERDSVRF
jgi:hypothetical protein